MVRSHKIRWLFFAIVAAFMLVGADNYPPPNLVQPHEKVAYQPDAKTRTNWDWIPGYTTHFHVAALPVGTWIEIYYGDMTVWTFDAQGRFTSDSSDGTFASGTYVVDASIQPIQLDLQYDNGDTVETIIEMVDARTLRVATSYPDNSRPTNFDKHWTWRWQPKPLQPVEKVSQIGGLAYAMALQKNYVYLAVGLRLIVMDVSDPNHPKQVGQTETLPDHLNGVAVNGNYVYAAAGEAGLLIIDVTDPTHPKQVGLSQKDAWGADVTLSNDDLYLLTAKGLAIFDVSNPIIPIQVGSYDLEGKLIKIQVADNYAYIGGMNTNDDTSAIRILDVSNPVHPVWITDIVGDFWDFVIAEGRVYITFEKIVSRSVREYILRLVDVSNPANPIEMKTYKIPYVVGRVAVRKNLVYVSASSNLCIIDLADSSDSTAVQCIQPNHESHYIVIAENYLYALAYCCDGFHVMDITDPKHPRAMGAFDVLESAASQVAIAGDYAYVASHHGLLTLDISNPRYPIGLDLQPGYSTDVVIARNLAYIVELTTEPTVAILDISNPARPVQVGSYPFSRNFVDRVVVKDNFAYIPGEDGLDVVDIAKPSNPVRVGLYNGTYLFVEVLAVSGDYLYLNRSAGDELDVLNMTDRTHPELVGIFKLPVPPQAMAIAGQYAYAVGGGGLVVLDISNPAHPTQVSAVDLPGSTKDVAVDGNYVYVASDGYGLLILDISDPTYPILVGVYSTKIENAWGVKVVNGYVYVAAQYGGLAIFRFNPVQHFKSRNENDLR